MKPILYLLAFICAESCFSQELSCPDPENKIRDIRFCRALMDMSDTQWVSADVYLPIKINEGTCQRGDSCTHVSPRNDTAYWNQITEWSRLLFTEYDLRNYNDPNQRLDPPSGASVDWVYSLWATKKTLVDLREAPYVTSVNFYTEPQVGISKRKLRVDKIDPPPAWVDPIGRTVRKRPGPISSPRFRTP